MKIAVKQTHINTACQRDSHHCMVADAIRDQAKAKYILVDVQSIRWSDMKTRKRYVFLTPPKVQQAILQFDRGKPVAPFIFTLATPVKVRPVRKVWTGNPAVLKAARKRYEKNVRKKTRRSVWPNVASRERQYGVRVLEA